MRPAYSTYVVSMIRRYFAEDADATSENYKCVEETLKNYSNMDKDIIKFVYSEFKFIDQVADASAKFDVNENYVWKLCKQTERKLAINRGLI